MVHDAFPFLPHPKKKEKEKKETKTSMTSGLGHNIVWNEIQNRPLPDMVNGDIRWIGGRLQHPGLITNGDQGVDERHKQEQ